MRISDWSSDVCSSDVFGAEAQILDAVSLRDDIALFLTREFGDRVDDRDLHRARDGRGTDIERAAEDERSEEHTSELQSLMRISYAVFCLKKKKIIRVTIKKQEK